MRIMMVVLASLTFLGCKNPTKELEHLADRACECAESDTACGNKVLADLAAFADTNRAPGSTAFNQAGIRLNDCLMSAGVKPRELTAALEKMAR
jgi:hypothetical protein